MCYDNLPTVIVLATRNLGKLREFQQLLRDFPFSIVSLDQFNDVSVSDEPFETYQENARAKAHHVMKQVNMAVLADDSGIEIDALPAQLGVHSARFMSDLSYSEKCVYLTSILPANQRTARFVAALALVTPEGCEWVVEGHCMGSIAEHPRGDLGFGYDPIFIPQESELTYAEMDEDTKNQISHRAHAVSLLRKLLGGS